MRTRLGGSLILVVLVALGGLGCRGARPVERSQVAGVPTTPVSVASAGSPVARTASSGTPVSFVPKPSSEQAALRARLAKVSEYGAKQLLAEHAAPTKDKLTYDPSKAKGLDKIQKSDLALTSAEQELLKGHGFVLGDRQKWRSFTEGYAGIYAAHLPLYISADSILHAVHRSFDLGLLAIERDSLAVDLAALLASLRARLLQPVAASLPENVRADLDVYLTVAASLLGGAVQPPTAGGDPAQVASLFAMGQKGEGQAKAALFGSQLTIDFSQLKPRGHYVAFTDDAAISRYFQAMMWLGRTEMRLVETVDGRRVFRREALVGALAFLELMTDDDRARYQRIDEAITAFVGEHDALHVGQLGALRDALGIRTVADLAGRDDLSVAKIVIEGRFGTQRIASQIVAAGTGQAQAFALFGQRYTVDSEVLSSVVHDRVPARRMMPSSLDVAYAALGNDGAAKLLAPELERYGYAPQLEAARLTIESHEPAFWGRALGPAWLSAIRALGSSAGELRDPKAAGLPSVFTTDAWGRRLLSSQLASWAELRHDTLLYTKQSYTSSIMCEFPDAYVDPYPELYARLRVYAKRGKAVADALHAADSEAWGPKMLEGHFSNLERVLGMLEGMARAQRAGTPFTAAQMAFVNETVALGSIGCGTPHATGWYPALFPSSSVALASDPTVADVHTQPTDENGAPVGRVLHVATGRPRTMVVSVDTCHGPRAYVGLVSSFYEPVTNDFHRMQDTEWASVLATKPPEGPRWAADLSVK